MLFFHIARLCGLGYKADNNERHTLYL